MAQLNLPEIKYWLEEARSCEERQRYELVRRNNYPFLINYFEGIEKINPTSPYVSAAESYAIINEYFPNTNALISELMYQNPEILTEATKPDALGNENLMKGALTYAFDKIDAIIENRVALFDMLYAGYSAVEIDHLKGQEETFNLPGENEDRRNILQKTFDNIKSVFTTEQVEEEEAKKQPEKEEAYATTEKTYIKRWNPLNVPLDWKAETLRDRRYNLKKVWLSKAEFDAKYPDFKDKVYPAEKDEFDYAKFSSQIYLRKILLYEFQIKRRENEFWTLVLAPNYTQSEIDYFKRPYATNGFNMKIGTLHKYGKLYPISFAQENKKMQDELNHYVRFVMEVAERNIPKYKVKRAGLKVDAIAALQSTKVNDLIETENNPATDLIPLPPTNISLENKELIQIFQQQKEKLWSVSDTRLLGRGNAKFMGELEIQEAGFQSKQIDIQTGLKDLIREELETLKDIIVSFWDGEYFFKITGGQKPEWYVPQKVVNPLTGEDMVLNALTDILTGDYEIKIDISTALRPNKERRKKEIIEFLTWLVSPEVFQYLASQGKTLNVEEFKKAGQQFGFNPETLLIDLQPALPPESSAPEAGGMPQEGLPQVVA